MSDIFVSYARATERQARQIADTLRLRGYAVWRDDELPAHRAYSEVIEERIKSANAGEAVPSAPTRKLSVCVLPFVNMSGDAEQEYFSDGISEDIITDLSKISAHSVIARNTAFTYKGKVLDVKEVARELGVSHVLEGSVRKAGSRVRITAQLIDGKAGDHL